MTSTTAGHKKGLGIYGEKLAAHLLVESGMTLLDRNWRCDQGEIDLVLRDGETLVVCEVKTRTSTDYGDPLEAVDEVKLKRLRRLAACWIDQHGIRPWGVRIDVVAIVRPRTGTATVEHVRGIG